MACLSNFHVASEKYVEWTRIKYGVFIRCWNKALPMILVSWLGPGCAAAMAAVAAVARNKSASAVLMVVAAVHKLTDAKAAFIPGVSDDPMTQAGILSRSLPPYAEGRVHELVV